MYVNSQTTTKIVAIFIFIFIECFTHIKMTFENIFLAILCTELRPKSNIDEKDVNKDTN